MLKPLLKALPARLLLLIALGLAPARAGDTWPQWRGPHRDGIAPVSVPDRWPDRLTQTWRVAVGEGHSAPLVADGKVFIFARQNDQEVAACLDFKTGEPIWQQQYDAPYRMNSAARMHGKGPKSTPVLHRGRLYTLGIGGILSCFEAATGRLAWRRDFTAQFGGRLPLYGTATSPVVAANGKLIAHLGGQDNGALMAFDAATGDILWTWPEDGPSYASPVIAALDSVQQIITQTQNACVGIALETGGLLWRIPFTTSWDQNIVTPVVSGDRVIFSGLNKGTSAYRPARNGETWTVHPVWHNENASIYMSSPVLIDGLLFGFAHTRKGHFFCLDAKTGEHLWQSEGRQSDQAVLISAGPVLLCQKSDAELVIIRKNREKFEPLARYTVADSPTWASPALVDGHILVKDASHLTLWSWE